MCKAALHFYRGLHKNPTRMHKNLPVPPQHDRPAAGGKGAGQGNTGRSSTRRNLFLPSCIKWLLPFRCRRTRISLPRATPTKRNRHPATLFSGYTEHARAVDWRAASRHLTDPWGTQRRVPCSRRIGRSDARRRKRPTLTAPISFLLGRTLRTQMGRTPMLDQSVKRRAGISAMTATAVGFQCFQTFTTQGRSTTSTEGGAVRSWRSGFGVS